MKRIAVVEDNEDNRMLVQAILEDDYELAEYADGEAALQGILESPPDLVLLDVSLPKLDGPEVLRRVRENPSTEKLPIVALTAHAMVGDRERFLAMGFDDYVTKPIVDEDDLLVVVRKYLQG